MNEPRIAAQTDRPPHCPAAIDPALYAERMRQEQRERPWFIDEVPAILPADMPDGRREGVVAMIASDNPVPPRARMEDSSYKKMVATMKRNRSRKGK